MPNESVSPAGLLWVGASLFLCATNCGGPKHDAASAGDVDQSRHELKRVGPVGTPPGPLDPPPAPPTAGKARPNAVVTEPELRVVPWAGFGAAVSYTFDDSQPSHLEHWAALKATGVRMTFFVNPSNNWQVNFDATWREATAAGHEIGNHTWSHCHADLSQCSPIGSAEAEVDETTKYIVQNLGVKEVVSFAAPFGESVWNRVASQRFLLGRGVRGGLVPPSGVGDWHELPAFTVKEGQKAADFNAAVDAARDANAWNILLFHSLLPTANNWYAGVELADLVENLVYAKSFPDLWLDTMGEIGCYVRAQQMFEALTPEGHTWAWTLPEHFPQGKVLRVTIAGGTLSQGGVDLAWDEHGYYEVSLDAGGLAWRPRSTARFGPFVAQVDDMHLE